MLFNWSRAENMPAGPSTKQWLHFSNGDTVTALAALPSSFPNSVAVGTRLGYVKVKWRMFPAKLSDAWVGLASGFKNS